MGMTLSRQVNERGALSFEHDFKLALITGSLDTLNDLLNIQEIESQVLANIPLVLYWGAKTENSDCFERLLSYPEIRQQISAVNHWCFFEACRGGNLAVLNQLLAFDEVLDVVASRDNFALSQAILGGHEQVIHRLLELEPVRETLKNQGETMLYAACYNGIYNAVVALLENPDIKNELSKHSFRCVRIVLKMGYPDILENLIKYSNVKDFLLANPRCIQTAVIKQNAQMLNTLLSIEGMAAKITSDHILSANLTLAELLYQHGSEAGVKFNELPMDSSQAQHIFKLQLSGYRCLKLRQLNFQQPIEDANGDSLRELNANFPEEPNEVCAFGLKIFMNLPKDLAHKTLSYLPLMNTRIPIEGGSESMSAHLDKLAIEATKASKP